MRGTRSIARPGEPPRAKTRQTLRRYRWLALVPLVLPVVAVGGAAQTASAATPFSIRTTPILVPPFKADILNYVVRCANTKTTTISTSGSGAVTIGGKSFTQPASVKAPLVANQAVSISGGGSGHIYTIRCLPADFPTYTSSVTGTPQVHGILVTPSGGAPSPQGDYVVMFDSHGVPDWWYKSPSAPKDAAFGGKDQIYWWTRTPGYTDGGGGVYTIRNLEGTVETVVSNPDTKLQGIGVHDFQILPNGDYLAEELVTTTTDLSSWGLSTSTPIEDPVLIEINPEEQVVWSWDALAHIDVAAEDVNWRSEVPDVFHMNSWQEYGNDIILSFRYLDAVFDIDKSTGNIIWKLGGTPTPQSLTVVGNTYPQVFSGQHDARQLGNGDITVHDNASQETGHAVRALEFQIDGATNTATIVQQVTDEAHPGPSPCCGSANLLPGGDWLVDWGDGNYAAELTPAGTTVMHITYGRSSYRAAAVPYSDVTLSHAMDAQYPPLHL